jgi:hypothetical protein
MANRCAGLDPTWAHLPAAAHCHPASSSWLFPATAFENEALTCALRASMSPASANPCGSSSYPTTPSSSSASGGYDAPALSPTPPQARRCLLGEPRAGRVTKRKPRPSRRPQPTYIMADPANFRRMVQEVTGFPVVASSGVRLHAAARSWSPTPPPAACILPTLDTSAFLFDRAVSAAPARGHDDDGKSSSGGASPAVTTVAAVEKEDGGDSSVFLELEAMACAPPAFLSDDFPTLESWPII